MLQLFNMKTMTCRQMGGPCDYKISGQTADEIMAKGEKHLRQMPDPDHITSIKMMEEATKDKELGDKWYSEFMSTYNNLPLD